VPLHKKERIKKNVKANVISGDHVSSKNYLCHLINLNVSHFTIITFSPFFLPPSPLIMPQWDWTLYGVAFKILSLDATSKWLWSHCSCRQPAIPKKSCNVQLLHECIHLITIFDTKIFSWLYFGKETVILFIHFVKTT